MIKYSKFTDNIGSGSFTGTACQNTNKFQKSGVLQPPLPHTHTHTCTHAHTQRERERAPRSARPYVQVSLSLLTEVAEIKNVQGCDKDWCLGQIISRIDRVKFFNGRLPQISLGRFLNNTLSYLTS